MQEENSVIHIRALKQILEKSGEALVFEDFTDDDWESFYQFSKEHTLLGITYDAVNYIPQSMDALRKKWEKDVLNMMYKNVQIISKQNEILKSAAEKQIPMVVLKGMSVAKYYPDPKKRALGDIDLLTMPEYFDLACDCLRNGGWQELEDDVHEKMYNEIKFIKGGVIAEIHHFAPAYREEGVDGIYDGIIFDAMSPDSTVLPDTENGLAVLGHIEQHLRCGIGLRQIIDWMMFCKSCLDGEKWENDFKEKARKSGYEKLAVTVTKMCVNHLGLCGDFSWCEESDDDTCKKLLDYIYSCGNFGNKRGELESKAVTQLPSLRHPVALIKYLQKKGESNWKALKRHPWLKPFAWIYQLFKYSKKAIRNKVGVKKLKAVYDEGSERNALYASLGIQHTK